VSVGPGGQPFVSTKRGTVFWPSTNCPSDIPEVIASPPMKVDIVDTFTISKDEEEEEGDESAFDDEDFEENGGF